MVFLIEIEFCYRNPVEITTNTASIVSFTILPFLKQIFNRRFEEN